VTDNYGEVQYSCMWVLAFQGLRFPVVQLFLNVLGKIALLPEGLPIAELEFVNVLKSVSPTKKQR